MSGKDEKEEGILVRILKNKDIQKAVVFFSIALILAFTAILPIAQEEVKADTVDTIDGGTENESIYYPGYRVGSAILELNFTSIAGYLFSLDHTEYEEYIEEGPVDKTLREVFEDEDHRLEDDANLSEESDIWFIYENETREYRIEIDEEKGYMNIVKTDAFTSRVSILDSRFNTLYYENITSDESMTWNITEKGLVRSPSWLSFENVSLNYTYTLNYESRPYSLLSLPAIFFTFVGMVFAFRGKGMLLGEIKQKQMEEEAKRKREESEESDEDDTGADSVAEGIDEEDVIYEGESPSTSETEKKEEAEHIDFMGIPDEDDSEDER